MNKELAAALTWSVVLLGLPPFYLVPDRLLSPNMDPSNSLLAFESQLCLCLECIEHTEYHPILGIPVSGKLLGVNEFKEHRRIQARR